jgi:hypothetical protein
MLGLNCIVNGKHKSVVALVEHYGNYLKSRKKGATARIDDVYNELRDAGFEIDKQVVAYAYANSALMGSKGTSTQKGLDEFAGKGMKSAIKVATKITTSTQEIDDESTPVFIAKGVANIFARLTGKRDTTTTIAKQLQDTLLKVVKSKLDKQGVATAQLTTSEILEKAFKLEDLDAIAKQSVKGLKNSIGTLNTILDETKQALREISSKIKSPTERAFFDQMVSEVESGIFDLLLTKNEIAKILTNELKEVGIVKTINKDGKNIQAVDWNKALEKDDWRDDVNQSLLNKGFSQSEVDRVMVHLEKQFNETKGRYIERRIKDITGQRNITVKPNKSAIEKVVEMSKLGLHSANTKAILSQALGIDNVPDEIVDRINNLSNEYTELSRLFDGRIPLTIRETYIREFQILLNEGSIAGDPKKVRRVVRHFLKGLGDWVDTSTSAILSSSSNVIENTMSGIPKSIITSIGRMISTNSAKFNPKLFWGTFNDVMKGGVPVRKTNAQDPISYMEKGDAIQQRLNFERQGNDFSNPKEAAKTLWSYVATTVQMINTAMDSANMAINNYNRGIMQAKFVLMKTINPSTGVRYTSAEANKLINEEVYGKKAYNDAYALVQKAMDNSGLLQDWKTKKDRAVYDQIINKFLQEHIVNDDLINALETAAMNNSNKELGRTSDVIFSLGFLMGAVQKDVSGYNKYAGNVFKRMSFAVGGAENWFVQKIQRKLGIGAVIGVSNILYDLFKHRRGGNSVFSPHYVLDAATPESMKKFEKDIEKRGANYARIRRGTVDAVVFYTVSYILKNVIAKALSDDDDDDEEKKQNYINYFEEAMKQPVARRLVQKYLPNEIVDEIVYAYDKKTKKIDPTKMKDNFVLGEYLRNPYEFWGKNATNKGMLLNLSEKFNLIEDIFGAKETKEQINARKYTAVVSEVASMAQIPFTALYDITKGESQVFSDFIDITKDPSKLYEYSAKQKQIYKKLNNYFREHPEEAMQYAIMNQSLYTALKGEIPDSEILTDISGIGVVTLEKMKSVQIDEMSDLRGKSLSQIKNLKDSKGKKIFNGNDAYKIYNQLEENTEGKVDISYLNIQEEDVKFLKALGYNGVGDGNMEVLKSQLRTIKREATLTDKGQFKSFEVINGKRTNEADWETIQQIKRITEQLNKIK